MKKSLITVHTVYKQFLPKLKPKSKVYNYIIIKQRKAAIVQYVQVGSFFTHII